MTIWHTDNMAYGCQCEWKVDGGGLVAVRGVYGLGLQDRIQRKISMCVTWEGCNAKMLRIVDLDLDLPE